MFDGGTDGRWTQSGDQNLKWHILSISLIEYTTPKTRNNKKYIRSTTITNQNLDTEVEPNARVHKIELAIKAIYSTPPQNYASPPLEKNSSTLKIYCFIDRS